MNNSLAYTCVLFLKLSSTRIYVLFPWISNTKNPRVSSALPRLATVDIIFEPYNCQTKFHLGSEPSLDS